MQRLGQHFLKNKPALEKIIGALALAAGDVVFEIGPGHGELTVPLATACASTGCKIVSIEKDTALVDELEVVPALKDVTFIRGDVLKILAQEIKARNLKHYKIVGNIPYYITGKLLRVMSELPLQPERAVLMVQKEVAERICEAPPDMNRLAASVQFWADPKIIAVISKSDFSPPPKIDSAIVALTTKRDAHGVGMEEYYKTLRALFAQPRKTILNNIAAGTTMDKAEISSLLPKIGIDPADRPQNLSIEDIVGIARAIKPDFWG